jgi:hypothetical protein
MKKILLAALLCGSLLTLATAARAQTAADCPAEMPQQTKCYNGQDQNGAYYWIAIPSNWNHMLVMHAHGGPRLTPLSPTVNLQDLKRFAVTVRQGYAWAGSSYRRPGYGVRMAAEDTENLRKIFIQAFGAPQRTILHGQSWGGNVAAKGIELYGNNPDGSHPYAGVVLTSGMLAGGSRNYLHRADLRAVYQYYCRNHPRPDEAQYPLWTGLPADSTMTKKELDERINECTGVALPPAQRSERQQRNLANILGVIRIPERSLAGHMNWATFMFRDLTQRVLGGRNPFSNRDAMYHGSSDDAALNRGVIRFDADPQAAAALAADSDMSGKIPVPVITMHAIDDPTAMVEYEAEYKGVVTRAGDQERLFQAFTDEHEHSKLADPEYAALFNALQQWLDSGKRPSIGAIEADCAKQARQSGSGCHFEAAYQPKPLFSRVNPR